MEVRARRAPSGSLLGALPSCIPRGDGGLAIATEIHGSGPRKNHPLHKMDQKQLRRQHHSFKHLLKIPFVDQTARRSKGAPRCETIVVTAGQTLFQTWGSMAIDRKASNLARDKEAHQADHGPQRCLYRCACCARHGQSATFRGHRA